MVFSGLIHCPFLFKIFFLCDSFYFLDGVTVTSFADDTITRSANETKALKRNIALFQGSFSMV